MPLGLCRQPRRASIVRQVPVFSTRVTARSGQHKQPPPNLVKIEPHNKARAQYSTLTVNKFHDHQRQQDKEFKSFRLYTRRQVFMGVHRNWSGRHCRKPVDKKRDHRS